MTHLSLARSRRGPYRLRLSALLALLQDRIKKRRSRAALARLDDRLLADIGLTRREAEAEAGFAPEPAPWDAPAHWMR